MVFLAAAFWFAVNAPAWQPVELPGLHNVLHVRPGLYSGSGPETAEAFRTLQRLGIQTVISVDGATPPVILAHQVGMRYVHLPFGYDGIPRETVLKIVKAVQTVPGPIYLHCHHGKHRAPAAAAAAYFCLEPNCTGVQAMHLMEVAGTDPRYKGLMTLPRHLARPSEAELARVASDFPEVAPIPALAEAMVQVDTTWDRLKLIEQAGWTVPPGHADLDPAHEALQLVEHFREATRLPSSVQRGDAFLKALEASARDAESLELALRQPLHDPARAEKARNAMRSTGQQCSSCHARYRDG